MSVLPIWLSVRDIEHVEDHRHAYGYNTNLHLMSCYNKGNTCWIVHPNLIMTLTLSLTRTEQ